MATSIRSIIALACLTLLAAGCRSSAPPIVHPAPAPAPPPDGSADHAIYRAHSGQPISLDTLIAELADTHIILIGEKHHDPVAHRLQAQIARARYAQQPQGAIAMEMFERDEQPHIDAYLDQRLSRDSLLSATRTAEWGGPDGAHWDSWYQPLVDLARHHRPQGAALIAANAPRLHVRLANTHGFDALRRMPAADRAHHTLPDPSVDDSAYRQRFFDLMTAMTDATAADPAAHSHQPDIDPAAYFRAQQLWDATMAHAVIQAAQRHPWVLLITGDFHIADQGGALLRIRHHAPDKTLRAISILPADTLQWQPEHQSRAHYIIYTRAAD